MAAADRFDTLTAPHRMSLKVQRSEFIGVALPLASEESFGVELSKIEKEFFDATHHCWAWRVSTDTQDRRID